MSHLSNWKQRKNAEQPMHVTIKCAECGFECEVDDGTVFATDMKTGKPKAFQIYNPTSLCCGGELIVEEKE
jgi:hypothetical protein